MEYNLRLLKSAEQTAWSGLVARLNELQICSEFGAAGVGEKGSQDAGSQRFPSSFTYIFIFRYTSFWATCQQSNIFIALKRFANNFCFGSCWRNRKMGRLGAEARAAGNHVVDICSNDLQLLIFIWPKQQLLKNAPEALIWLKAERQAWAWAMHLRGDPCVRFAGHLFRRAWNLIKKRLVGEQRIFNFSQQKRAHMSLRLALDIPSPALPPPINCIVFVQGEAISGNFMVMDAVKGIV